MKMENERREMCFLYEHDFFEDWRSNVLPAVVMVLRGELGLSGQMLPDNECVEVLLVAAKRLEGLRLVEHDLDNWFAQGGCAVIGEIEGNLKVMGGEERKGYVYTLVEPFVSYQMLKYMQIEDGQEATCGHIHADEMYTECRRKKEKSPAECVFSVYENILEMYGRALDFTLLRYGVNLQWYERYFGIHGMAGWRQNEREEFVARHLHVDIREAARMVDEALPRLDAERPAARRETAKMGIRGYLLKGGEELLEVLHRLMDGKKGKRVALVLYACMELGYMTRPTQGELLAGFGITGSGEGINKYLRGGVSTFDRKDVEAVKKRLMEAVERHEKGDSVPKTATRNG